MDEQKTIALSVNLVNAILQYLGSRPFVEVAQLINGVQQQAQGQVDSPDEAATTPQDVA